MTQRLPWKKNPSSGYIAYPDGDKHQDRFATVATGINSGGQDVWRWSVHYAGARLGGEAPSKQEAADAATEGWTRIIDEADAVQAEADHRERIVGLAATAARTGELPGLDLGGADYDDLIALNWHLRQHFERLRTARADTRPIETAMLSISNELFARRNAKNAPSAEA